MVPVRAKGWKNVRSGNWAGKWRSARVLMNKSLLFTCWPHPQKDLISYENTQTERCFVTWVTLGVTAGAGRGRGQPWQQGQVKAVWVRCFQVRERKFSPFLQILPGFKTLSSSSEHLPVIITWSFSRFFFCGIDLIVSNQPLELSYVCWLLVGGHNDLADGPYKWATMLLGIFLSCFLVHLFDYAWHPGHSIRSP